MARTDSHNVHLPLLFILLLIESNIYSASFTCNDGHFGSLLDHVILDNGRVEPSVVCTYEDCTFHDYITLDGWNSNGPKSEGYV